MSVLLLATCLCSENGFVYAIWVSNNDKMKISHIGLRYPLDIVWCNSTQTINVRQRISPAATYHLIHCQLTGLSSIRFLSEIILSQILLGDPFDIVGADLFLLQTTDFVQHNLHRLVGVNCCYVYTAGVCTLTAKESVRRIRKVPFYAHLI